MLHSRCELMIQSSLVLGSQRGRRGCSETTARATSEQSSKLALGVNVVVVMIIVCPVSVRLSRL